MNVHLAFDRSDRPGDVVIQSWRRAAPIRFAAPDPAPAPSRSDVSWAPTRAGPRGMCWGIAPVYVGQRSLGGPGSVLTTGQGRRDAEQAATLAASVGIAEASVLYLDIGIRGDLAGSELSYLSAWVSGIRDESPYWAGVHCAHGRTAALVNATCGREPTWVFHPVDPPTIEDDRGTPGGRDATAPRYRTGLGGSIDLVWTDTGSPGCHRLPHRGRHEHPGAGGRNRAGALPSPGIGHGAPTANPTRQSPAA